MYKNSDHDSLWSEFLFVLEGVSYPGILVKPKKAKYNKPVAL